MNTLDEAGSSQNWVDGNAAAGILATVFALDATKARIVCAGCGHGAMVGEQRAFALEMGAVLRCPNCAGVTLRVTVTQYGSFIDMRGAEVVHFA